MTDPLTADARVLMWVVHKPMRALPPSGASARPRQLAILPTKVPANASYLPTCAIPLGQSVRASSILGARVANVPDILWHSPHRLS
jgi:hypothetical protein